jgi:type III secretory pathway component EscU
VVSIEPCFFIFVEGLLSGVKLKLFCEYLITSSLLVIDTRSLVLLTFIRWLGLISPEIRTVFISLSIFDFSFKSLKANSKLKIHHKSNSRVTNSDLGKPTQGEVDAILDKIIKGGYESLTKKEKEILFKAGK